MVKSRFTSTDIAAMVAQLRPVLLGSRVVNVYDIAGKLFMIKFSSSAAATAPGKDEEEDEEAEQVGRNMLLIESGVRFHLTQFERKKSAIPSGWTMNLRKLIKNKQLEKIEQIGVDRVVVLQFGIHEKAVNVILEMYAKGNIVVTDFSGKILMFLRSYQLEEGVGVTKNEMYPLDRAASVATPIMVDWQTKLKDDIEKISESDLGGNRKKISGIGRLLGQVIPFAHVKLIEKALENTEPEKDLVSYLSAAADFAVSLLESAKSAPSGYVSFKGPLKMDEFAPCQNLLTSTEVREYPTFSRAVDEFYHSLEQRSETDKVDGQRKALTSRVENIRADQTRRIEELVNEQQQLFDSADLLEQNLEVADAAIMIINTLISKQLSWPEIVEAVESQKRLGHGIASRIGKIFFQKNQAELMLDGSVVTVLLDLNAAGNVAHLHAIRKAHKLKVEKTEENAAVAIKQAELKLKSDINQFDDAVERSRHLSKVRKRFWFEKFYWFVTSENFLVIAGRDATQNEAIYKKYLRAKDAYVHADIHGAATVVVKNHTEGEIPPLSLAQAGQFSLCHSSAWNSKIVTSAWWVRADQVSKTAPTGEYLTTGSFMIRGKKNFLPPSRLELGIGILFYLSEDSAKNHPEERRVRGGVDDGGDDERNVTESDSEVISFVNPTSGVPGNRKGGGKKAVVQAAPVAKSAEPVVQASPPKAVSARTQKLKQKAKKKQDKYEWSNDEEEDEAERIRKQLLGIKSKAPEVKEPEKEESVSKPALLAEDARQCYKCGEMGHFSANCPLRQTSQKKETLDDDQEDDAAGPTSLSVLNRLAATVVEGDEMLHAVAVCGPYSALSYYLYRLKVIPGSTKRGKAAKMVTQIFGHLSADKPVAKSLIKSVPVEEISECLVQEVKVTAPGIQRIKAENKKKADRKK